MTAKKQKAKSPQTPRLAQKGDIAPAVSAEDVERFVVSETTEAAQEAKIAAVRDIVRTAPPHDSNTLAKILAAIMDGASADDAEAIRNALLRRPLPSNNGGPQPDDLLSNTWREGGYPYKHLMSRKAYEKQ